MKPKLTRRKFIANTAAISAGVWLGGQRRVRAHSPNEKLNLAFIGVGGRGGQNVNEIMRNDASLVSIVALCDVDDDRAGRIYEQHPKAQKFYDYRQMLDKLEKQIDAVVISTPDHGHYHQAVWSMERGKHVYLEKPLAHCVWEVRQLTRMARERKLATQMGNMRHAWRSLRRGVEVIQAGTIGDVKECYSWFDSERGMLELPAGHETAPDTLNWDLWVGPAQMRPYSKSYVPYIYKFWWDFGTGETGNWGCHVLDIPYWALGLTYPTKVAASGPPPDPQRSPKRMAARFEFPATDARGPVTLHWYQGLPPILSSRKIDAAGMNNLFIGSEGMLLTGFDGYKLLPEAKFAHLSHPEPALGDSPGFYREFFEAAKGGQPASCNFDYSGPLTETTLLGNVAYRAGGQFEWDAGSMRTIGNTRAQAFIRDEYRTGWELARS